MLEIGSALNQLAGVFGSQHQRQFLRSLAEGDHLDMPLAWEGEAIEKA